MTSPFPLENSQGRLLVAPWTYMPTFSRNALKKLESPHVTIIPGVHILTRDKAHKAMTAVGKGHHKGQSPTKFARRRIDHHRDTSKIHLGLLAWLHSQANCNGRKSPGHIEATTRRIARNGENRGRS